MKKQTFVRILAMLLLTVMVLAVFCGCKKNKEDAVDGSSDLSVSTNDDAQSETETLRLDKNGYLMDDLPEDLSYPGQEITVLGWDDAACEEFDIKELGDDEVENAIYFRDQMIQARLGVTLKYTLTPGSVKKIQEYKQKVQNAYLGNEPYDITASYTRSIAICASANFLQDLSSIPGQNYLDLEKPWWSSDVVEKTSTNKGKYYFVTGDASTNLVQMIYCVYFNADIVNNTQGMESPYDLVANNQWTIEKLLTMSKGFYKDNGKTGKDLDDNYGLLAYYFDWPALLHGCGINYMTKDAAGDFILDPAIKSQKTIDLMDEFQSFVNSDSFVCDADKGTYPLNNFKKGLSTFIITHSGTGIMSLKDLETFNVGVVPCPKYDTTQENYYSTVRQPVTFFGIMNNVHDDRLSMLSAVLECWGSEAYRGTTPIIFETNMKYKGTTDPRIPEMLQLIKDTAYFDCARIYADETEYLVDRPGRYLESKSEWANYIANDLKRIETQRIPLLSTQLNSGK